MVFIFTYIDIPPQEFNIHILVLLKFTYTLANRNYSKLNTEVHTCNAISWRARIANSKPSLGYIARPCLQALTKTKQIKAAPHCLPWCSYAPMLFYDFSKLFSCGSRSEHSWLQKVCLFSLQTSLGNWVIQIDFWTSSYRIFLPFWNIWDKSALLLLLLLLLSLLLLFYFLLFWDMALLYTTGPSGACCVDQAGLEFMVIFLTLPPEC